MPTIDRMIRAEIRAILTLAAPLAGANLAGMAMGLTNAIVVGRLGGASLAAAGLGAGMYFTLVMICQGVLIAVAPLAAHAIGAGDRAAAGRIGGAGLLLAALVAAPVLALLTAAPKALALLGYAPSLADDIARYLSAVRWGAPAFLFMVVLRAMLSAGGRVRPVMVVLLLGVPANAALNVALVFGRFGLPEIGIAGSGCATAIVQWLMLAGMAGHALTGRRRLRVAAPTGRDLLQVVRLGLPISGMVALEVGLFNLAGVLMGLFGADALGAHQLTINFASLTFMAPLGIGQAATVRVAQQLGAGQPARARLACFVALALGAAFMLGPSLLMLGAPRAIAGLYIDLDAADNAAVFAIAERLLAIGALFQVFDGVQVIAAGALRGYRDALLPMLIAAFGYWGVGFAGGWVLAFPLGRGPVGIWWGLAAGLAVVSLLLSVRLHYRSRPAGVMLSRPVAAPFGAAGAGPE